MDKTRPQPQLGWTFTLRSADGAVISTRTLAIDHLDAVREVARTLREGLTGRFAGGTVTVIDFWGNDLDAPKEGRP